MKNLLFAILLAFVSIQATVAQEVTNELNIVNESLAQRVDEHTSLYDAVCILNDIVPGSIGMKEGRELMADYAKLIGLNYKLYLKNGGNNLHILHYVTSWEVMNKDVTVINECTTCILNHDAQDRTIGIDPNADASEYFQNESPMSEFGTEDVELEDTVVTDTVVITVTETVIEVVTETVVDTVSKEYCDCDGLSLDEAWTQHNLLKEEHKADVQNHNGAINSACRVKLRQYIWRLQRQEYDITRAERMNNQRDGLNVPMIGIISVFNAKKVKAIKTSNKPSRKRRTKKLGKGHAKGKGNGFFAKIFPFINCKGK